MLAIIPARGGSKGLPGKNVRLLAGKPLIAYTIQSALESREVSRVVVSTDSEEIAGIAREYGADIPFMRPAELASDNASAMDTYIYTVDRISNENNTPISEFVVLQPTSPLRMPENIDDAIELFYAKKADSVISMTEEFHPPVWAKRMDSEGRLTNYFDQPDTLANRQVLPTAYMPNGSIYVFRAEILKEKRNYYTENTYAYLMPKLRSVDIDDIYDFEFAEYLIRKLHGN